MIKVIFLPIFVICLLVSCRQTQTKKIEQIRLNYKVIRFDSLIFNLDTIHITQSMQKLKQDFPNFTNDYLYYILQFDTSFQAIERRNFFIKNFIRLYKPLYDSAYNQIANLSKQKKDLYSGFQHLKYYFPQFMPPDVYTYIASFNGLGVAIFPKNILGIGMQMFLGKDFSYYQNRDFASIFPAYISKRFAPEYMVRMSIEQLFRDLYPIQNQKFSLIEQMVIEGRYWYVLKQLLPQTPDTIITQYSKKQLTWCEDNERDLWQFVLAQNKNMYSKDPETIRMYLGEAPFTQNIGQQSPGNIGSWIGRQIVASYIKNNKVSLQELMQKNPAHIFQQSKYLY